MIFTYTAKRSVQSSHNSGTQYSVDVDLSRLDRYSFVDANEYTTISGIDFVIENYARVEYDIATVVVENNGTPSRLDMIEFLDSVKGGEVFELDDNGNLFNCKIKSTKSPFLETRLAPDGWRYSFRIVIV